MIKVKQKCSFSLPVHENDYKFKYIFLGEDGIYAECVVQTLSEIESSCSFVVFMNITLKYTHNQKKKTLCL